MPASTTPRTRRQHYVPSCYLSQWATPKERDGRIMVFDRKTGAIRPSTPGHEAHARDFYAVEVEDRSDTNIAEDALAKLEGIFAPAITRVNETRGLPVDRRPLMAFIAMQHVRTPSARAWFDNGHNVIMMAVLEESTKTWERFLKTARKIFPDDTEADLKETYDGLRDFLKQPGARMEMDQTTLIKSAFDLAPDLEDELMRRCWLLGMAPDDAPLVTSDDPIVLEWNGKGDPPASWNPGVGDPQTVVLVPLGPRHVLAGVPKEVTGKRRKQLTREQVAHFNTQIACRAARFVYFSGPNFPFDQDGKVMEGPTDWLKGDETDPRAGKKRGVIRVIRD
jgi:hypothetical protein